MLLASYGGKRRYPTKSGRQFLLAPSMTFLPPCLVPSFDRFHNYIIQHYVSEEIINFVALPAESPNMSFSAWFVSLLVMTSFYE